MNIVNEFLDINDGEQPEVDVQALINSFLKNKAICVLLDKILTLEPIELEIYRYDFGI